MASIYSVTQVNSYIKNMFAQDFALNKISVQGEISNCKYHSSGHIYFTLKDKGSAMAAVMFAGQRRGLKFQLQEGQQVIVRGSIEVYERDGRYQLYAQEITKEGIGDLYDKFIKLRDQLEEMGMFAAEYKQPVPKYAAKIGIVTAATGAAIQDIKNISSRRNPYVELILYPALVQGEKAKYSIVRGIKTLDSMGLDVIIVGRGGGSIEDLWAFNEEMVASAIFHCQTPVISAVGHETDVTIADYVADMRAPTPSAAAELAVFDYREFEEKKKLWQDSLRMSLKRKLERSRYRVEQQGLRLQFFNPARRIRENRQRLADSQEKMKRLLDRQIQENRQNLITIKNSMKLTLNRSVMVNRHRLEIAAGKLDGLSPLKKMGGGFGFITDRKEQRVQSVEQVQPGDLLKVRLQDGSISAVVKTSEALEPLCSDLQ